MSPRDEGVIFHVAGKAYVWTRNQAGRLEAVSPARVREAVQLLRDVANTGDLRPLASPSPRSQDEDEADDHTDQDHEKSHQHNENLKDTKVHDSNVAEVGPARG